LTNPLWFGRLVDLLCSGEVFKEGFSLEQQKEEGSSKKSIGSRLIDEPSLVWPFSGSSLQHGAPWVVSSWL
jgi:hypothetical protein